jgi:DNA-nicking Smr family endonuclease
MIQLDLHGHRHEEVKHLLERILNSMWGSEEELHIITGYSERLQKIVVDILREYNLEYSIGDFSGRNMGYVRTVLE